MVVIDKYYEFVDKPSMEITRKWKVCHILLYTSAVITGMLAHYMFSVLKVQFNDNCILSPNVKFTIQNLTDLNDNVNVSNSSSKIIIDYTRTSWGNTVECDYCEYAPVMSMIVGSLLLTFFIMCPRGGSRESQSGIRRPWHIVMPTLFITIVFLIFISVTSSLTYKGIESLCDEFRKDNYNGTGCYNEQKSYIQVDEIFGEKTFHYIKSLHIFLAAMIMSWMIAVIILCFRCCTVADFKLMEVTVSIPGDDTVENLEETEVLLEQNPTSSPVSHV